MEIKKQLRQFITTNFYVANPDELSDEASLLDAGVVDSTGVLEVIGFIEETFGIEVEDEEMIPENLDSIARIAALVARKAPSASGSGQPLGPGADRKPQ
jgi:acyl carrier protein